MLKDVFYMTPEENVSTTPEIGNDTIVLSGHESTRSSVDGQEHSSELYEEKDASDDLVIRETKESTEEASDVETSGELEGITKETSKMNEEGQREYTRLNWIFRIVFTLASTIGGLSSIAIKQLLLPLQVSSIAPGNINTSFAIVASLGALAGLIASPFTLAFSDRTISRFGRRRIWIMLGTLAGILGLIVMALAQSIPVLLFGEIIAQIGVDTVLSAVGAIIPDQVPQRKRSSFSALNGMAPIVGGVLGLLVVSRFTNTKIPSQGYIVLIGMSILFVALFLVFFRDRPVDREQLPPFHLGQFFTSFLHPLTSSDFTFTLISRCLVFLSFQLLGAYTFFYLLADMHFTSPAAASGVATFQLISTVTLLIAALIAGAVSGKFALIKPFVIVGALLMAIGLLVIAFVHVWTVMLLAAVVFGMGFGVYLAVDMALAIRVLPSSTSAGKDLAIINTAIFLPLILSPIIGAFILNLTQNNYELLFAVAAVSSILAAVLVLPIRSVR
jgi:MFS family permease